MQPLPSIHEATVANLCNEIPGLKTLDFRRELFLAIKRTNGKGYADRMYREEMRPTFKPDAYLIDDANRTVTIYEVEDTHKIGRHKMWKLAKYWFDLDGDGWTLKLIVTDRYGHSRREVDLRAHWYRCIEQYGRSRRLARASS